MASLDWVTPLMARYQSLWRRTRQGEPPRLLHLGGYRFRAFDRPTSAGRKLNRKDIEAACAAMEAS